MSSKTTSLRHVLVTGGAGYIGSHTTLKLLAANIRVTIVDNLCNSKLESFERIREISGKEDMVRLHVADLCDPASLETVFKHYYDKNDGFDACIHFAALKAVGESVKQPLKYYKNNLTGTFNLLDVMSKYGCKMIVFSSSATVYGSAKSPLSESSSTGTGITNPYGQTKFMMESVLRDLQKSDPEWRVVLLRYFNPVGAHPSGRIGEDPKGIPNNLMPYVQQVAVGRRPHLNVFGDDYPTVDGTGVRDYIHVVDLADGHMKALAWASTQAGTNGFCDVFNLGTGSGSSVLQVVKSMEKACGHDVPYKIAPRRDGDLAEVYANPKKAQDVLKWRATRTMDVMCADSWRWQSNNPTGFGGIVPSASLWLLMVRYAMEKKCSLWDVLAERVIGACVPQDKKDHVNTLRKSFAAQLEREADTSYARGPCVRAVDELIKMTGLEQRAVAKCAADAEAALSQAVGGSTSDEYSAWCKARVEKALL